MVQDVNLSSRLIKLNIPKCASVLLEIESIIPEPESLNIYKLLINQIKIDFSPDFTIDQFESSFEQNKTQNLSFELEK